MKNLNEMKARQKDFVGHLRGLTEKYVAGLEKEKIQTILLSGSVARGDYFPGKLGGYVDLIVMTKEPNFDANTVFGKDIEPEIPYHCVETFIDDEKIGFEIDIRPFVYVHKFETFDEPGKWSILESKILYDENDLFSKELSKIEFLKKKELKSYIVAEAMRVLKDSGFFGKTLCSSVSENLNSSQKDELLVSTNELFEKDPLIAMCIEKNLFTFDMISNLDDRSIQKILRETDSDTLAMALKNAPENIQEKIFRNMSKRAANLVKEDMEFLGPVKPDDVNAARDEMIKTVIALSGKGEIVVSSYWE